MLAVFSKSIVLQTKVPLKKSEVIAYMVVGRSGGESKTTPGF